MASATSSSPTDPMTGPLICEALADAFATEGMSTLFALLGDGNMHWVTAMQDRPGIRVIHVRHEHCAVGAAIGHFSATGDVGVASVTCGPGFTQIMTALATAARGRIPLVIFAGEVPLSATWHQQRIDQASLAAACGARYIAVHSGKAINRLVLEAFYAARQERMPVVLGVPFDLQKEQLPQIGDYRPSASVLPASRPVVPNAADVASLARRLAEARYPILIAGRGVLAAGARDEVIELADRSGALLATTLAVRGLFDAHPFSLGVCGGWARQVAEDAFARADLVIAIGASLSSHTLAGGKLFRQSDVAQIDVEPAGLNQGHRTADIHVRADAKLALRALIDSFAALGRSAAQARDTGLQERIRDLPAEATPFEIEAGTLDPRAFFETLERILPKDYHFVSGSGHHAYFHTTMRGFDASAYHAVRDFGAIGNALSYAIGVAVARDDGRVVLFEGDGGLMMHVQELETIKRHKLKLLIVCSNDGAFGAEVHKLRHEGLSDAAALHGRADFESIARGFGLKGATVTDVSHLDRLVADYEAGTDAMVWNVHVSDRVINPSARRNLARHRSS